MTDREITPPYMSVSKLEEAIDLVSSRNFEDVSVSKFMGYGFSKIDAQLAVSMLRFLGLIDENLKATERMPKIRLQGDARKKEFEELIKDAYSKLFTLIPEPQNLSAVDLRNDFISQYGLSDRVARTAIPVFLKLCEWAGLKEPGTVISRKRKPTEKNGQTRGKPSMKASPAQQRKSANEGELSLPIGEEMSINLPMDWHTRASLDDELNTKERSMMRAAHDYAAAQKKKDDDEKSAEVPSEEAKNQ